MIKRKTGIEILLWILFLLACSSIGYIQGLDPEARLLDRLSKPTAIRIFTVADAFFPPNVVSNLEKDTHTKISIVLIRNWDDLNLQVISSNAPDILFIPSHWAKTLHQEVLLNSDVNFQKIGSEDLSNDFKLTHNSLEQDFIPAYWAQLGLYTHDDNPAPRLKNKNAETLRSASFLADADLFIEFNESLKKSQQDTSFYKLDLHFLKFPEWLVRINAEDEAEADLFLKTHVSVLNHPHWKMAANYAPVIYILGFALPKNSENQGKALQILKSYLSLETQRDLIERLPFASTLSVINRLPAGAQEKKASYIRDLVMKNTLFVKTKEKNSEQKARELSKNFDN